MTIAALSSSDLLATLVAALSGICFAGLGTAYKLGQSRRVSTLHILMGASVVGMALCAPRTFSPQMHAPAFIWIAGIAAGLSQYVTIHLISKGLAMGSLSVVWCIVSLAFFPTIPYACLLFDKSLALPQYLGLAAAIACVLTASFGHKNQPDTGNIDAATGHHTPPGRRLLFLAVLAAILACNAIANVIQTHLSHAPIDADPESKYLALYAEPWMFALYASCGLAALVDLALRRKLAAPLKWTLALGALGGVSSQSGIRLQNIVAIHPMSYAINGAVGIVAAAAISMLLFGEHPSKAWYATIALGLLAVVLGNLG